MERLIGEQMALPCALFNTKTVDTKRPGEGQVGVERAQKVTLRISRSAEKFAGIEGLEVMVEMSRQRENIGSGIVQRHQ